MTLEDGLVLARSGGEIGDFGGFLLGVGVDVPTGKRHYDDYIMDVS
jgi:hypothetical protein